MSSFNDLAITATNRTMISAVGATLNFLQSRLANGGRDANCKFYYNNGAGGSILQVVARSVTHGAIADLKDFGENAFNSLLNGKRNKETLGKTWVDSVSKRQEPEKEYGKMVVKGGTVYALDDWGCKSPEALMLGIDVDKPVMVSQNFPNFSAPTTVSRQELQIAQSVANNFKTNTLVWYDTTALITINSDKNFIATKVQGRDYSRKELVSNGDIKFSVSGQITSGRPDIYPSEEIRKFVKVMQYKGIVKVNNQVLDQLGISHIVITDFSISPQEGYKSLQKYSFSAIGLQPEKEIEIENDTVTIIPQKPLVVSEGNGWVDMLKGQLDGLKSISSDLLSQSAAIASGLLDNVL